MDPVNAAHPVRKKVVVECSISMAGEHGILDGWEINVLPILSYNG